MRRNNITWPNRDFCIESCLLYQEGNIYCAIPKVVYMMAFKLMILSTALVIKVISYCACNAVTRYFTAASWKGSEQHLYNGSTIMRSDSWDLSASGLFEALVKRVHTNTGQSVIVCACYCLLHDAGRQCWITESLNKPPVVHFLKPPLPLPLLLLSKSTTLSIL